MIRHCVFLKFKPEISATDKQLLYRQLADLGDILPGIMAFDAKANTSPEIGMDKGFSDGFIIDFDTEKSRDTYLDAPEHKAVGAQLVAASQGGAEGILVYDMKIG